MPSLFVPTPGNLIAQESPPPGICHPRQKKKTALLEATNEWLWNIDNSLLNGVILLDLKKAFDTMDHAILLYGVSSQSLNWFHSYLSDRKQQTFIYGVQSDFCNITCGIPQGSILGQRKPAI